MSNSEGEFNRDMKMLDSCFTIQDLAEAVGIERHKFENMEFSQELFEDVDDEGIDEDVKGVHNVDEYDYTDGVDIENDEDEGVNNDGADSVTTTENDPESTLLQRKARGRRKGVNKAGWFSEKQKELRMRGKAYLGYQKSPVNGKRTLTKLIPAKSMGETCTSVKCQKVKFCHKIPEDVRRSLFRDFWELLDWKEKRAYVKSHVDYHPPKRQQAMEGTPKLHTFNYYLKHNGVKRRVCRNMFLNTLGLESHQVFNWMTKAEAPSPRTSHTASSRRDTAKKSSARDYLIQLPKLPSHYCRAGTSKLYLEPIYASKTEVYKKYLLFYEDKKHLTVCEKVFFALLEEMKIGIFQPKKDRCDVCCSNEGGNLPDQEYKTHLAKKESARNEKAQDKKSATDGKCHVITVDLQAVKLAPMCKASALYYKTKLVVHNYTVYNVVSKHAKCYFWDETQGDLKASIFATNLINYLETYFTDNLSIIIYSDGCTYQNRNVTVSNALLDFAIRHQKVVIQKFLERGHTQMEVDSVHAVIERKLRNKDIYHPGQYAEFAAMARETPSKYEVEYLTFHAFKDYEDKKLQRYTSIRPGSKTGDPTVTDLRQIKYNINGTIQIKLDHAEEWRDLSSRPREVSEVQYASLYDKPRKISQRKYKDLIEILHVIPSEYHNFYKELDH